MKHGNKLRYMVVGIAISLLHNALPVASQPPPEQARLTPYRNDLGTSQLAAFRKSLQLSPPDAGRPPSVHRIYTDSSTSTIRVVFDRPVPRETLHTTLQKLDTTGRLVSSTLATTLKEVRTYRLMRGTAYDIFVKPVDVTHMDWLRLSIPVPLVQDSGDVLGRTRQQQPPALAAVVVDFPWRSLSTRPSVVFRDGPLAVRGIVRASDHLVVNFSGRPALEAATAIKVYRDSIDSARKRVDVDWRLESDGLSISSERSITALRGNDDYLTIEFLGNLPAGLDGDLLHQPCPTRIDLFHTMSAQLHALIEENNPPAVVRTFTSTCSDARYQFESWQLVGHEARRTVEQLPGSSLEHMAHAWSPNESDIHPDIQQVVAIPELNALVFIFTSPVPAHFKAEIGVSYDRGAHDGSQKQKPTMQAVKGSPLRNPSDLYFDDLKWMIPLDDLVPSVRQDQWLRVKVSPSDIVGKLGRSSKSDKVWEAQARWPADSSRGPFLLFDDTRPLGLQGAIIVDDEITLSFTKALGESSKRVPSVTLIKSAESREVSLDWRLTDDRTAVSARLPRDWKLGEGSTARIEIETPADAPLGLTGRSLGVFIRITVVFSGMREYLDVSIEGGVVRSTKRQGLAGRLEIDEARPTFIRAKSRLVAGIPRVIWTTLTLPWPR